MKSKTNKIKAMIVAGAALGVCLVLTVGAPAMAGMPRVAESELREAIGSSADLQRVAEMTDSLGQLQIIPGAVEAAFPEQDPTPIPDGGDWEPAFPEQHPTPIPDGGDWEPSFPEQHPTPIPDGGDWEPSFPDQDPVPAPADEGDDDATVDEEPGAGIDESDAETPDDSADDVTEDEPQQEEAQDNDLPAEDEDSIELPFTGGSSTPWLIAGAVVLAFGAGMLLRRPRHEDR